MIPLPWSYTSLSDFVNCPRAFHQKRVLKLIKEEKTPQIIWGEYVHKQFENRQRDGTPLPVDLAYHEDYMKRLEDMPGIGMAEEKIALNKQGQPCEFFDPDVWYRGVIDFNKIHKTHAHIVDYKTGKVHHKYEQLKLFALHVFAQNPNVETVDVRYYWTQTQQSLGETYTRDMIPNIWKQFVPNLKQYATAFHEDIWQPRQSGLCKKHCAVFDCEFNGRSS